MTGLRKFIYLPLLLAQVLALDTANANLAQGLGAIIGGVAGGVGCNHLARNQSNGVQVGSTIACTLAGAFIGNEIGKALSRRDQDEMVRIEGRVYDLPVGEGIEWQGDNHYGRYDVIQSGYWVRERSAKCRTIRSTIYDRRGRVVQNETRTTCRHQNQWYYVQADELLFDESEYGPDLGVPTFRPDPIPSRPRPSNGFYISWEKLDTNYLYTLNDSNWGDPYRLTIIDDLTQYLRRSGKSLSGEQLRRALDPFQRDQSRMKALRMLMPYSVVRSIEVRMVADAFFDLRFQAEDIIRARSYRAY